MTIIATAGHATADSYFTINDADAYFSARGVAAWGVATTDAKEQAARKGTSYLENAYRDRWRGLRATQTQALAWPRVDGSRARNTGLTYPLLDADGFEIADDAVPVQVQRAAMEAALLALGGTVLEPTLARGGAIKSQSKGVGPLSKSTTYMDGAPVVDRYTLVEGLLRGLVSGTPGETSGILKVVRG